MQLTRCAYLPMLNCAPGPVAFPCQQFSLVNNHYMYFTWWYIAVFNSNASAPVSGVYSVSLTLPSDPGQRSFDVLINKLQLGIIGAVAGEGTTLAWHVVQLEHHRQWR